RYFWPEITETFMITYKLNIIGEDGSTISHIHTLETEPYLGRVININEATYEIVDLVELMRRRRDFACFQVQCQPTVTDEMKN
ncbi:MAG: hypothetical protein AAF629_33875, partial [Chloroflexota bacterium]